MRFFSGDIEIPYDDFRMKESFNQPYTTIQLASQVPVSGEVTVKGDGVEYKTVVADLISDMRGSRMVLIPQPLSSLVGNLPKPFLGRATTKKILEYYKVPFLMEDNKEEQYWHIPSMNIFSFLDFIKYKVNVGYAPVSTFSITGVLLLMDLKQRLSEEPEVVGFYSNFTSRASLGWIFNSALNVELTEWMLNKDETKDVKISDKWGKGRATKLLTVEELEPLYTKEFYNKMGVVEYTTSSITIESSNLIPALGACIALGKSKAVITEGEITPNTVSITASAPTIEI